MLAQDLLDDIKQEVNYNPQFDDTEIIPLINRGLRYLAQRLEMSKEYYEWTTTQGTFEYLLPIINVFRITAVFYGQESVSTKGYIDEGFKKLVRCEQNKLGTGIPGYWMERTPYETGGVMTPIRDYVDAHKIVLAFDPEAGKKLRVQFITWREISQTTFDTNDDIEIYFPRELNECLIAYVVWRLKVRDRDETAADAKGYFYDLFADLEDTEKERTTYLED